ncbi:MAG: LPS export ABC transporter ATP-binding protein [Candidatus Hydrogenedentota bacterium]|nr:MAG: LPS export ABC transporter ATP-binding protein [Candidatus Hydrogenedentota bacterium]
MTLEAHNLTLDYGRKRAVDDLSLRVERGQIVGLLGPNGAGKTSTFYMIVGLLRPLTGRVLLDDEDITHLPLHERARKGIAYLPQEASVFRDLTVEENLIAVLEYHEKDRERIRRRTDRLLEQMGLERVRESPGRVLSGGERRRVEIARALAIHPKFLLLDEPFAGIDPKQVSDLQQMIGSLKQAGLGVLITDHNVHEMLDVVDTATIIHEGRILKTGNSHELVNDPLVRKHYLGDDFRWESSRPKENVTAAGSTAGDPRL